MVDLITVVIAGLVVPLSLMVIINAFPGQLFTDALPAVQSQLVAGSIAGFAFPEAFLIGFGIAFAIEVLFKLIKKKSPVILMAFGIGMFFGLGLALMLAIGGLISLLLQRKGKETEHKGLLAATGIMGGEGVTGFLLALFIVAGIPKIIAFQSLAILLGLTLLIAMVLFSKK